MKLVVFTSTYDHVHTAAHKVHRTSFTHRIAKKQSFSLHWATVNQYFPIISAENKKKSRTRLVATILPKKTKAGVHANQKNAFNGMPRARAPHQRSENTRAKQNAPLLMARTQKVSFNCADA